METVPTLKPWEGTVLKALTGEDLPKPETCTVFNSDEKGDRLSAERILKEFSVGNRGLNTTLWKSWGSVPMNKGQLWTLSMNKQSLEGLEKLDMSPSFRFGRLKFRRKREKKLEDKVQHTAVGPKSSTSKADATVPEEKKQDCETKEPFNQRGTSPLKRHTVYQQKDIAMEEEVVKIESRCKFLERKLRKNNVIIFGIVDKDEKQFPEQVLNTLNQHLETNFTKSDINNVYTLGKTTNAPIIIEFISFFRKLEIFQDKEKLKNLNKLGISISNDLFEEDRNDASILRKHLKQVLEQNKTAKLRGYKLEIEGRLYTARDFDEDTEYEDERDTEEEESDCDTIDSDTKKNKPVKSKTSEEEKKKDKSSVKRRHASSPSPKSFQYRNTRQKEKRIKK
ncbi:unnamed protein product [Ceutorhynchus assimilis]|uniref:DUF4780 domain-containing protein n=1 Tax=Ceutorhynchus assimilis TaxID=467358 RepID=A0A9N9QPG7_9CUCU|nr:unnamed protein product [Ceutorhynchus assimilis]